MNRAGIAARLIVLIGCLLLIREPLLLVTPHAIQDGDSARQNGKAAEAIADYRTALEAQPNDPQLLTRLIESSLSVHRPDMATLYMRQLAMSQGWTPALYRNMAEVLVEQGDEQQAVVYWQSSLTGTAQDIDTLRKLAAYATANQDWKSAINMLTKLIALAPNDDQALYQLGLSILPTDLQAGMTYLGQAAADPEYRTASNALQSTIIAHNKETTLNFQIGLTLMSLKLWPYAEHALSTALEHGQNDPATLAFLGVTQDQQGRDGWPLIEQAFTLAPNDPIVNYASALHWRLAGDTNQALISLNRAHTLDPKNPAVAAEIGLVYQMAGRMDYAAQWFTAATSLAPQNASFQTLLATFYADTGYNLNGDGLTTIRKIADQLPNNADVRASLGWALFSSAQYDAARVELEKALVLDPTNVRARYYFAVFLEKRDDPQSAIEAFLYVYRDPADNAFKDLAAVALKRLGYSVDPNRTGS